LDGQADSSIVNPAKLDHKRSSEVCGQCHGVYVMRDEFAMQSAREGALYRPGDVLERTRYYIQHPATDKSPGREEDLKRNPSFFRERWWDDGTILAGGREYTAMSASKCFTEGKMSCLSCHSMHESDPNDQLTLGMDGPRACTQCHNEPRFTSDLSRHTFHRAESSGSDCLNCHMPHTTYALFKAIRSHQISSPNTTASASYGTPNACNLCHLDRTLAWAQDHLVEHYGQKPMALSQEQQTTSAALLWLLKGHAAQRAIAAWHFGWKPAQETASPEWMAPFVAQLLPDPYGVVRYIANRSLRSLPGGENHRVDFLSPELQLRGGMEGIVAAWRTNRTQIRKTGTEILVRPDGQIAEEPLQSLLLNRDNRPVTIKE
jgi:predicted CXXCH cytochrome family protein